MKKTLFSLFTILLLTNCASYKSAKVMRQTDTINLSADIVNVFLIGDAGKPEKGGESPMALLSMQEKFSLADENDVLLFLGDNVYEKGIPEESAPQREAAEVAMNLQLAVAKAFPGKSYFIPGNHDWYSGLAGVKRQEKMVEEVLGENTYRPGNGCPLDIIELNEEAVIVTVDSHWYVAKVEEPCGDINSNEKFLTAFNRLINQHKNKTLVIAIHHPLMTDGSHDGQFPIRLAFPVDMLRKITGFANVDMQHPRYRELSDELKVLLAPHSSNAIVVSGHEHNLQYIEDDGVIQIVSGGGSKESALRMRENHWGFAGKGFAILQLGQKEQCVFFYDKKGKQVNDQLIRKLKR